MIGGLKIAAADYTFRIEEAHIKPEQESVWDIEKMGLFS